MIKLSRASQVNEEDILERVSKQGQVSGGAESLKHYRDKVEGTHEQFKRLAYLCRVLLVSFCAAVTRNLKPDYLQSKDILLT